LIHEQNRQAAMMPEITLADIMGHLQKEG